MFSVPSTVFAAQTINTTSTTSCVAQGDSLAVGYDPNIKYVCLNPKGVMTGGSSSPNFTVRFRARVN